MSIMRSNIIIIITIITIIIIDDDDYNYSPVQSLELLTRTVQSLELSNYRAYTIIWLIISITIIISMVVRVPRCSHSVIIY